MQTTETVHLVRAAFEWPFCLKTCYYAKNVRLNVRWILKLDLQFHLTNLGQVMIPAGWGLAHTAQNSLNVL